MSGAPKIEYHRGKVFGAGAGIVFLIILILSLTMCGKPQQGTILYGICSTFLEQNVPYPEQIERTSVQQYPRGVRIYYAQIDPFGQHRAEMIECAFMKNEQGQIVLETVLHNRAEVDQEIIDKFNPTIPIIAASDPNLDLPRPRPGIVEQIEAAAE